MNGFPSKNYESIYPFAVSSGEFLRCSRGGKDGPIKSKSMESIYNSSTIYFFTMSI